MTNPDRDEHIQSLLSEATQISDLQIYVDKRLRGNLKSKQTENIAIEILGRLMFIKSSLNRRVQALRERRD